MEKPAGRRVELFDYKEGGGVMAEKGVTLKELQIHVDLINEKLGYEKNGPGSYTFSNENGKCRIERYKSGGGVEAVSVFGTKAEAFKVLYAEYEGEENSRKSNPVRPLANSGRGGKIGDCLWDGGSFENAMMKNRDYYGARKVFMREEDAGFDAGKYYIALEKMSDNRLETAVINIRGIMKNAKLAEAVENGISVKKNKGAYEELKKELAPYIKDKGYPFDNFKSAAAQWVANGEMKKAFAMEKLRINAPEKVDCYKITESVLSFKESFGEFAEVKGHPCSAEGASVYSFSKGAGELGCVIERKKGAGFQQFHVTKIPWGKSAGEFLKEWDKDMAEKIFIRRSSRKSAGGRK